jgi:hypothetical protein
MARERSESVMTAMDDNAEFRPATCNAVICSRNVKGKCSLDDIAWGDAFITPNENGTCQDFISLQQSSDKRGGRDRILRLVKN